MSWQLKVFNGTFRLVVKPLVRRAARQAKAGQERATIDKLRRRVVKLNNLVTRKHESSVSVAAVDVQPAYVWINNPPCPPKH